jgi:phenylacetate-CoA ligase
LAVIDRGEKSRLLRLSGRTSDVILLPSGKRAAGLAFYYISRNILESGGALKEFVIKQVALDSFVFEVVTDRPLSEADERRIRHAMNVYLEDDLKLTITTVEKIERPIGGKIKHFYSLLP